MAMVTTERDGHRREWVLAVLTLKAYSISSVNLEGGREGKTMKIGKSKSTQKR